MLKRRKVVAKLVPVMLVLSAKIAVASDVWFVSRDYSAPNPHVEQMDLPPSTYSGSRILWDPVHDGVLLYFTTWNILKSVDYGKTWNKFVLPDKSRWAPERGSIFFDDEGHLIAAPVPPEGQADGIAWVWETLEGEPKTLAFKRNLPFRKSNGMWYGTAFDDFRHYVKGATVYESQNALEWAAYRSPGYGFNSCLPSTDEEIKRAHERVPNPASELFRLNKISPRVFAVTIKGHTEEKSDYTLWFSTDAGKEWQVRNNSQLVNGVCDSKAIYVASEQKVIRITGAQDSTIFDIKKFDNIEALHEQITKELVGDGSSEVSETGFGVGDFYIRNAIVPNKKAKTMYLELEFTHPAEILP